MSSLQPISGVLVQPSGLSGCILVAIHEQDSICLLFCHTNLNYILSFSIEINDRTPL